MPNATRRTTYLLQSRFTLSRLRAYNAVLVSLLAFFTLPSFATDHEKRCTYRYEVTHLRLGPADIAIERYIPLGRLQHPLVVMLHGSEGAYSIRGTEVPQYENFGEKQLAASCFDVALPHYLDAFGVSSMTSGQAIQTNSAALLSTVNSILDQLESGREQTVPVFLYGESLGAYLALSVGFSRPEVRAISEVSGGLFQAGYENRPRLTVLISHGKADTLVPFVEAERLDRFCRAHQITMLSNTYPRVGHVFPAKEKEEVINKTIHLFKGAARNHRHHK